MLPQTHDCDHRGSSNGNVNGVASPYMAAFVFGCYTMELLRGNEACGSSHLVLSCPVTDPTGCNILSDMAVHDVDMIVWLTQGQEPEFIYVVTHSHDAELAEAGVADSITVLLKYKSGVIAAIDSCRETTYGYDIRVEVSGE